MPDVVAAEWHRELAALARAGYAYLDLLTAVDRGEQIEVVARVVDPDTAAGRLVSTRVDAQAPEVASIVDVFPGADWHEREAAEMFGIRFAGHPDPRPLLTSGGEPLLRKAIPLQARVDTPWPGADVSARRRARVPGVPDAWQVPS